MQETQKTRVVVAMSGGVDSSVAAALLREQGYDVVGISMQVWDYSGDDDSFGTCCSLDDINDARRVAEQLDIPFYVVNFEEEFRRLVIENFVDEYVQGRTPNPCVRCNQWIKFDLLLRKALELGADLVATGHYARIMREGSRYTLMRGLDPRKDQTYFLFTLTQEQLARTLFPVGEMEKDEVRQLAERYGLRTARKKESQEICFVPDGDYGRLIEESRPALDLSGDIVDTAGRRRGTHGGTYRYTIGQRKGLGIANPAPLYVTGVDAARRQVIVGEREALFAKGLTATDMNWIVEPAFPLRTRCRIRYRHEPVPCTVTATDDGRCTVTFDQPEKSVTPGQAVVFYEGDTVLGGGWIEAGF